MFVTVKLPSRWAETLMACAVDSSRLAIIGSGMLTSLPASTE
jgi:hypothetical protein